MAISGVTDYTSTYAGYADPANSKKPAAGETGTAKETGTTKGTGTAKETAARKTAAEELSYLTEKYKCLKSTDYSVSINSSLLAKAAGDEKTSEWLEYNLSLIPKAYDNLKSMVAARGAKLISCNITMDGYDSMTTEVVVQDEVDPGTEKARKELKKRIQERKEEEKRQEEKAAKRREKKEAEENAAEKRAERKELAEDREAGTFTVSAVGTDVKSVTQTLIATVSGASVSAAEHFDMKA